MALTDFTIIRRSLFSRLFSTVTTVLTVAVAVGLMLVLLSLREAGRKAFERGSGNMHLLVSADSNALTSVLNGIFYANAPQAPITWAKYHELVALVFGQAGPDPARGSFAVPVQMGDSYRGFPVCATTPEFFSAFRPDPNQPWELAAGAFFDASFEVVVGAAAARDTGLKVGDRLALTHGIGRVLGADGDAPAPAAHVHDEYSYTVVGILRPTGSAHDRALFTDLDSAWIIHAQDRIEREGGHDHDDDHAHEDDHAHDDHDHDHDHAHDHDVAGIDDVIDDDRKITGIYVRLPTRAGSDTPAILPQVFDMLRRDTSITVAQPAQQIGTLFGIVSNIDQIFLGMAAAVMVSSGIAILLALYNSMDGRRREIAVLRVLGCSRPRIFGLILTESAVIGLLGAAAGVLISLVGGLIVAGVMKERLGLVITPSLNIEWALPTIIAAIALASLAGLLPAMLAYRTPVAKNLKPLG